MHYRLHQKWLDNTEPRTINRLTPITHKFFVDTNNLFWIRLDDCNYPRTALFLPKKYRQAILCEAHGHCLSGHDAIKKTYLRITNSYFWPTITRDIREHIKTCLQCQLRKKNRTKPVPLAPLPVPEMPNDRVHVDLFGPLKTSEHFNKYILCMTDAATKYSEVVAIPSKEAHVVADQIFNRWICRFGTPFKFIQTEDANLSTTCQQNYSVC